MVEYLWPKISLDTGAPLAHLLPTRYERSKCCGGGGAKPLLYAAKTYLASTLFKKSTFPPPPTLEKKKSSCERLSSLFCLQKTCLGLYKSANKERMIFFERGGGDLFVFLYCGIFLYFILLDLWPKSGRGSDFGQRAERSEAYPKRMWTSEAEAERGTHLPLD